MDKNNLKQRTRELALRIIKVAKNLPKTIDGQIIAKQIIRSGTSVGANYRAVCRARSKNEFIAKLGIVIEEADETMFWLEIIMEAKMIKKGLIEPLLNEANEITAIMVSSANSASKNNSAI